MLTALLGAPAALAACRRPAPDPAFTGRLLGQDAAAGHRVRDGYRPEPEAFEDAGVVIVGAGAAGLSAAWKLARSGFASTGRVVVLELEDHPGGTAAWGQNAVSAFPWGAHYVPAPSAQDRALVELLGEMGVLEGEDAAGRPVVAEEHLCRAPQERLFLAGRWHEGLYPRYGETRGDAQDRRAFDQEVARWVAFRDAKGRRAFTIPSVGGADDPELDALDRISMADYLAQKGLRSARLRWWVEYGCRDDYGATLETCSAYAGLFYFAARVEAPGARAAGFVTFPEGNGRILRHLAGAAGAGLRTGVAVTDVRPVHGGEGSVEVRAFDVATGRPLGFRAGHVIFALPRYLARRVVAPFREAPPPHLDAFVYSPWMVANLTLRDRPKEKSFPLAWDNVLYASKSLGYVTATHQTGRDYGPTVLTYYLPLLDGTPAEARARLLSARWEDWAAVVLADLERAHPGLGALVTSLDVWRWGHAMVRPVPGLLRGGALGEARAPLGRIHFANTDLSGMALFEEALHWGVVAAEAILAARGVPFKSSLG
jgi:glycine/D-amino acid oxidase-like deaminating enzyme